MKFKVSTLYPSKMGLIRCNTCTKIEIIPSVIFKKYRYTDRETEIKAFKNTFVYYFL